MSTDRSSAAPLRAAVTAVGIVCALGEDLDEVRARIAAGESGVRALDIEGAPGATGAAVEGPNLRPWLTRRKDARLMARPSRLLLPAAARALGDWAGDREGLGLFFGVGREPADGGESNDALSAMTDGARLDMARLAGRGRDLYPPLLPLKSLPNMALAHVSIQLGIRGPGGTFTGGPEAGVQALRDGIAAVAEGRCPAALAGGTDAWVDAGALRDRARLGRSGPPGEAAVVLRLEPADAPGALFILERGRAGLDVPPDEPEHRAALGSCGAADGVLSLVIRQGDVIVGEAAGTCCEVRWIPC